MKTPLLITKTPHGKSLRVIDEDELRGLLEDDEVEHVKGNVYRTKVMVPESHYMRRAPVATIPAPVIAAEAPKRKRGRPPKAARATA